MSTAAQKDRVARREGRAGNSLDSLPGGRLGGARSAIGSGVAIDVPGFGGGHRSQQE